MAYSVSQDFKDKIKDQTAAESCLILFDDLFFSTADFTDNGVIFNQFFNTSEDLTFGDCPSDTLSFSVVSNGTLSGYRFGKCRAFLGVQTGSSPYAFGDINAHIEVGNNTYTASDSGLYRNDSKIDNGVYVSLVSDGTTIWAVGLSSSVSVANSTGTVSSYTPTRFMAQKLRSGLSAVFASNTAYVWDGENLLTYEYVPMGEYNVNKPRSTVGDVVTVQDAYDNMTLFDKDASQFLGGLTYPITLGGIYTALCDFVGVSYASSTFTYSTTSYSSSPFSDTSCTLRDILWWIAERARKVAHFNRDGQLALMNIGPNPVESLTASDIAQDGFSIAEYITPKVTGVLLKGMNGSSLTFGSLDTAYVISANPFISTISNSDLNAYWAIPRYVPFECEVLEADPSIDVGDMINIRPAVEDISALTDVYGQIYAVPVALTKPGTDTSLTKGTTVLAKIEAYAVEPPTYTIPLMERELRFIGGIRAKYVATGNEEREADISDTEYNANVAFNQSRDYANNIDESFDQQKVFNRLTNNGQAQGIFLDSNGNLYINGTYIQAHTVAVDRLTGTVSNGGWGIDFTNGTMSIGTLAVGSITGSLSTTSTTGTSWGINFGTGTINIGTLAVGKITGTLGNTTAGNWGIDFTNGTMSIGKLAVGSITGSLTTTSTTGTSWGINFTNGTMNIGTLAVGKITGSLSTTSTSSNAWGIDFSTGTINIGTLAVSRITGSKSLGNNWSINFDTGVMTIGTINADNINGGTISGSSINLGNGNFVVNGSTGAVTIKSGSIDLGSGKFKVTSAGALTSTSGLIGNWSIDSTRLYKTATTTVHTFNSVDLARISGVLNGTLDEATVLASYPYYDLDGDGHITKFDAELAIDAILGFIPNGVISSATTQLYPSKVYGAISSVYDMSQGIGFVSGPFGVYGTGLIGKSLKIIEALGSDSSSNYTYLNPSNFVANYAEALQYPQYYTRSISVSASGISFSNFRGSTPDIANMDRIVIRPTVVSTW